MHPGIVIQARLGSSRFPGKISTLITERHNLLEFETTPLLTLGLPVVIALPDTTEHHHWSGSLKLSGVQYFFGDELNVLNRYVQAARHYGFTSVVRVCADNPCMNVSFLKTMMQQWTEDFDYAMYVNAAGIPATRTHYGLFSEIAKVTSLISIRDHVKEGPYTEHVTPYFYEHPDQFRILKLNMPEPFWSGLKLRFTVDTPNDFRIMKDVIAHVDVQDLDALVHYCLKPTIRKEMEQEILKNEK